MKKVVVGCAKKIHSTSSLSFFPPTVSIHVRVHVYYTTDTNTDEASVVESLEEKGAAPPSSILERSFLKSGGRRWWWHRVGRNGPLGPICPQFLCEVPLGIVQPRHVRSSRAVSCRESAASNARNRPVRSVCVCVNLPHEEETEERLQQCGSPSW